MQISWNIICLKLVLIICIVAGDKFTIKALLCNIQYFYIVDSDLLQHILHCYVFRYKMIKRTRHSVPPYEHCCGILKSNEVVARNPCSFRSFFFFFALTPYGYGVC